MSNSSIPVLDFSPLSISVSSPSEDVYLQVGKKAFEAFSEIGFVYLVNHGILESNIQQAFESSMEFFNAPEELKEKFSCDETRMQGWTRPGIQTLSVKDADALEFKESYEFSSFVPETAYPDSAAPDLRPCFERLFRDSTLVARRLLRALAHAMNLQPDYFDDCHQLLNSDVNSTKIRSLYYPPIVGSPRPGTIRCGEHTDFGSVTLLFQDALGGLEVKNVQGEFVPATPRQGAIVVNSGYLLEIWSSGAIPATVHRVVIPVEETKRSSARQSIALFARPDDEVQVKPLDGSDKYKEVNSLGYLKDMYKRTYQKCSQDQ